MSRSHFAHVTRILTGAAALLAASAAAAFEFTLETSCVYFNVDNTDILERPLDCDLPENLSWCNCTRSVFTNPVRGQASALEQGIIWVTEQPGIGNHRIEVGSGTLDLSAVSAGAVIGETLTNELIPEAIPFVGGQFFRLRSEIRVTAVADGIADFDVVVVEMTPAVGCSPINVLRYCPTDAAHSNGLFYRGRLEALAPGHGFIFEYRYEKEEGAEHAAIEASDAADPGFNVRFSLSLFTRDGAGIYTLGDEPLVDVESTLRKFTEASDQVAFPEEILPLGAPDLCEVVLEPEPCRSFVDTISTCPPAGCPNRTPEAQIVVTDALLQPLLNNEVFLDCGVARAFFRGSNSTDGEDGAQGLTFLWEVTEEPEPGAATIPAKTASFMDTEISFAALGEYTIRLTVDDGQSENNVDSAEVTVDVEAGQGPNLPPEIFSLSYRGADGVGVELLEGDPPFSPRIDVELAGGTALIPALRAQASTGADGCVQENSYVWTLVSGPGPVELSNAFDDTTDVALAQAGEYSLRVTVDDGGGEDNITTLDVAIVVSGAGVGPFLRGDCSQQGQINITSGIFLLSFLFSGGATPPCMAACNTNGEGAPSITSAIFLFNFLFLGGGPPPAPYPECGGSTSEQDIEVGCAEPADCGV